MATPRQQLIAAIGRKYRNNDRRTLTHNTGVYKRDNVLAQTILVGWATTDFRIEQVLDGILANLNDDDPRVKYAMNMSMIAWRRFCNEARKVIAEGRDIMISGYSHMFYLTDGACMLLAELHNNPDHRLTRFGGAVSLVKTKTVFISEVTVGRRLEFDGVVSALSELKHKGLLDGQGHIDHLMRTIDVPQILALNFFIRMIPRRSRFGDFSTPIYQEV